MNKEILNQNNNRLDHCNHCNANFLIHGVGDNPNKIMHNSHARLR